MPSEVAFKVDAAEFSALFGKTSQVAPKLKAELRKSIKSAAEGAAVRARQEVAKPPLQRGQHPRNRHLRSSIAADIKVVLMANNAKGAGVQVKAGAARLDGDRKKLVKAYNRPKGWRHPVFARIHGSKTANVLKAVGARKDAARFEKAQVNRRKAKATWVRQKGRTYFSKAILMPPGAEQKLHRAVLVAMETARRSLK